MKKIFRLNRLVCFLAILFAFLFNQPHLFLTAAQSAENDIFYSSTEVTGLRYLSIPAAAFVPGTDYFSYENHGRYLKYISGPPAVDAGYFVAPVQLPQGAVLKSLTFHYKDSISGQAELNFVRHTHDTNGSTLMAAVSSVDTWAPGFGSGTTMNFNPTSVIDNNSNAYYVHLSLPPGGQVWGCAAEIAYTLPVSHPTTVKLSVPPAAFAPFEDGYAFMNAGWNLVHNSGAAAPENRGWYLAPLDIPDGATVTRMVFHWLRNDTTAIGTARLQRTQLEADTYQDMAVASSPPGSGSFLSSTADTTIDNALIDNQNYAYWIILDLPANNVPGSQVEAREVDIEYQLPSAIATRVSISAPGFHAYEDGYDYEDHGRHFIHKHGPAGSINSGWYMASLNLPDGAVPTKMTFYWYRNGTFTGTARLQRTTLGAGNYEDLAVATVPVGTAKNGSSIDTTIAGGLIDNSKYAYWLVWDLPANSYANFGVHGHAIVIDYGFRIYLPIIQR